jgi:AraC-like DNA-binding protein
MPSRAAAPPTVDRTGDPDELVGATEAARVLNYSRPEKLPTKLIDLADVARTATTTRKWKRRTLWLFHDTERVTATTTIDGRTALDRAGIIAHTGAATSTVANWLAHRNDNGFPTPVHDRWYFQDDVDTWLTERTAANLADLTPVDRTGDPDELVTKTEAARIAGYQDASHLNNSPLWQTLQQLRDPADDVPLPGGGTRQLFRRSTVWQAADLRPARRGRHKDAAPRVIDRTGDPDELVGASEAARVLGYRHPSGLTPTILERADIPLTKTTSRKWKRRTLWAIADETQP